MPEAGCVLGLDGGGTRTVCLIVDRAGRELARGLAGPSNHQSVGLRAAQAALGAAISTARRKAGDPTLSAACLGMAGLDREEDLRVIRKMSAAPLAGVPVEIVHDADIALAAGNGGRLHGVVIIAGTGSIALGYDAAGRRARAGGWGHVLGDEGSGYDLARRGLSAATRARDGRGPATCLAEQLPAAAGEKSLEDLADRVYLESWTVGQVASLAPAVLAAAGAGDPVAQQILVAAAEGLAAAARAVIAALELGDQVFPVILSGGIFSSSPHIVSGVQERISAVARRAGVRLLDREPAYGAALLALRIASQRINEPASRRSPTSDMP